MAKEKILLINPEIDKEPLFLEFESEIPIGNRDEIVCEISLEQAYNMMEHAEAGTYFEDNIHIPLRVREFILKNRKKIKKGRF